MATVATINVSGLKPLLRAIEQMPEKCRMRILQPTGVRAGRMVASAIRPLIPVQQRMRKPHTHYRDAMTSVAREYPKTQAVVVVVGPESRQAPHAHLVEFGTGPRFIGHKTQYRKTAIRVRQRIVKGQLRHVTEKERKSIGSFLKKGKKNQILFNLGSLNRGRMPAFRSMSRGISAIESRVRQQIESDIRSGITRELAEAQIARGK
jgi:hypothetical protein